MSPRGWLPLQSSILGRGVCQSLRLGICPSTVDPPFIAPLSTGGLFTRPSPPPAPERRKLSDSEFNLVELTVSPGVFRMRDANPYAHGPEMRDAPKAGSHDDPGRRSNCSGAFDPRRHCFHVRL